MVVQIRLKSFDVSFYLLCTSMQTQIGIRKSWVTVFVMIVSVSVMRIGKGTRFTIAGWPIVIIIGIIGWSGEITGHVVILSKNVAPK